VDFGDGVGYLGLGAGNKASNGGAARRQFVARQIRDGSISRAFTTYWDNLKKRKVLIKNKLEVVVRVVHTMRP
jgi:hypothetical protein